LESCEAIQYKAEENGINIKNEGQLHSQIKQWYLQPGDRLESKVDGYIIDIVRNDLLIEIQTKNFSAINKKLKNLLKNHKVVLVHPIAVKKMIVKVNQRGEKLSTRKSPTKGTIIQIFDELIRIPTLIYNENFRIEVLMINMEEIRCVDGKGSWRRKGVSIIEKRLVEVLETVSFESKEDFLKLLSYGIDKEFTNKTLSKSLQITINKTRKVTYCLKKMGLIKEVGKKGNELIYILDN
jgi:hypothetical protein